MSQSSKMASVQLVKIAEFLLHQEFDMAAREEIDL